MSPRKQRILRKVGGSVMLAVPPALLDLLNLSAGQSVALAVDNGRPGVEPRPRPRCTLEELLARCDARAEAGPEDRERLDSNRVGDDLV